jgi:hypothetical protein
MKVYIAVERDYDDLYINAVYTDKVLADRYVERYGGDVDEYETDTITEFMPKGVDLWNVFMVRDGCEYNARIENNPAEWKQYINREPSIENGMSPFDGYLYKYMQIYVLAKNEKEALKLADKKRLELIEQGKW